MAETGLTPANAALIQAYLDIVATDDYQRFDALLTADCTFSLMPIGYTFRGLQDVMAFVNFAGNRRRHDDRSHVVFTNQFTDGEQLCVEYEHSVIISGLGVRSKIDGYCLVFHFREGRFDAIREYINPSRLPWVFFTVIILRLYPLMARANVRRQRGQAARRLRP
jgi:ketosteroid isomerase-like protein